MFLLFSVITHHIPGYHQTWLCPLSSGTFHILPYFPMNFSQLEPPKMVNLQHIPSHLQHSSHSSHASNRDGDCWTHGLWARVMQTTWPQPQRCGYPAMALFHGETGHENWCHGWFEEILPQYAMDKWTIRIFKKHTESTLRLFRSWILPCFLVKYPDHIHLLRHIVREFLRAPHGGFPPETRRPQLLIYHPHFPMFRWISIDWG